VISEISNTPSAVALHGAAPSGVGSAADDDGRDDAQLGAHQLVGGGVLNERDVHHSGKAARAPAAAKTGSARGQP